MLGANIDNGSETAAMKKRSPSGERENLRGVAGEQQAAPADQQGPAGGDSPDADTDTEELPLDVVFDILRNRRRRLVLRAIEELDGQTTLGELAEHIAGIENDKLPRELNSQERKRVYVGLYQCHLPRMDDAGAIDFEQNRGTVERGPYAEQFYTYLDREPEPEPAWYRYYGPVAASGCLGVFAATVFVTSLVSAVAIIAVFAVCLLAVIHTLSVSELSIRSRLG